LIPHLDIQVWSNVKNKYNKISFLKLGGKKKQENGKEKKARRQRKPKNAKNKMGLDLEFWPFYKSLILGLAAMSTSKTLPTIFSLKIGTLDFQNLVFIFF
jgi:hypothetical protein